MIDRIVSVMQQEYFITKRSLEVIFDLFIFSTITVAAFSFVSKFLIGSSNPSGAFYLLVGLLLWEIVRVGQYSITVSVLWNVWSRNLSNMFVTPLSTIEFFAALMISSVFKCILVIIVPSIAVYLITGFNITSIGWLNLALDFINLLLFAWAIGIGLTGAIFRFGTRIQAMSWGFIFLFQPLGATYFPVSVLPDPLQKVAYFIPVAHVFESARKNITNQSTDWNSFFVALILNAVYLVVGIVLFYYLYRASLNTGQFARNEG